jgi:hypothetical protein
VNDNTKARWSRLVSDWESTDLSQPEFARERGISVHALRYWLYRLRSEAKAPVLTQPQTEKPSVPLPAKEDLRLLPVASFHCRDGVWPCPLARVDGSREDDVKDCTEPVERRRRGTGTLHCVQVFLYASGCDRAE